VRVAVVGAGTARVFDEVSQSDDQSLEVAFSPSKAMGKVLASELPRVSESTCKVLYPASAKASREIRESVFCLQLESSCYFLLLSLRPHVSHIYCVGCFMMLHIDFDPVNFLFSS